MNLKNMLKRLTSNYRKDEESNVYKLFATAAAEIEEVRQAFEELEDSYGIEKAKGESLDLIGEDLRQPRIGMSDEEYRPRLRFKAAMNRSMTDINSVNTSLKSILGDNFKRLREDYAKEPASVVAEIGRLYPIMPFSEIQNILAGGVRLKWAVKKRQDDLVRIQMVGRTHKKQTYFPFALEYIDITGGMQHGIHCRRNTTRIYALEGLENTKQEGVFYFGNYTRKYVQKRMEVEQN